MPGMRAHNTSRNPVDTLHGRSRTRMAHPPKAGLPNEPIESEIISRHKPNNGYVGVGRTTSGGGLLAPQFGLMAALQGREPLVLRTAVKRYRREGLRVMVAAGRPGARGFGANRLIAPKVDPGIPWGVEAW